MSQCGSSWGLICYSGTTLHGLDYAHISMVVVFNGVLTGSGCLAFRSHLLMVSSPNCSQRWSFCSALGNSVSPPCCGSTVWYGQIPRENKKGGLSYFTGIPSYGGQYPGLGRKGNSWNTALNGTWPPSQSFGSSHWRGLGISGPFFVIKGVNWMVGGRETANGNRHD